jgi:hypothetical protein
VKLIVEGRCERLQIRVGARAVKPFFVSVAARKFCQPGSLGVPTASSPLLEISVSRKSPLQPQSTSVFTIHPPSSRPLTRYMSENCTIVAPAPTFLE